MSALLAFIDTETTSLRHDRRAWEVGLVVREPWTVKHPDGPDTVEPMDREYHWFIDAKDLDLGDADLTSLKIGRFYDRHPAYAPAPAHGVAGREVYVKPEAFVLAEVERLTRGAHLAGAVVSFDAEVLGNRMRANGICPSWHYHLIDVEALAIGYLAGKATSDLQRELLGPPWKSDALSSALGITVSDEERHTALGDARWAMRIYDAVTGGAR